MQVTALAALVLLWLFLRLRRKPKRRGRTRDHLATVLLWWTPHDPYRVVDLLTSVAVLGRTGSGKTSSSGKALGRAIVGYPRSGMLILAAKPEDKGMWERIFEQAGKRDALIVVEADGKQRFNVLDYIVKTGGDTREVVRCLMMAGEVRRQSDTKGGENSDFFEKETERELHNAVEIVRQATGSVSAPLLQDFIAGAAQNPQMLRSEEWQKGMHNRLLKLAFERKKDEVQQADFEVAFGYWVAEYPNMADKTRSSIEIGAMGTLHTLNLGIARRILSTATTFTPDDILQGKSVLINLPVPEVGDSGAIIGAMVKYGLERRVLARTFGPGDCIVVIWQDEAHLTAFSYDPVYLSLSRSHGGCMVSLTQSLHNYATAFKGHDGMEKAKMLISGHSHLLFHALGDPDTAQYASQLLGKQLETFVGGSMPPEEDLLSAALGYGKFTGNFSEHYSEVLQPREFMHNLRTGGPENGLIADAILIRSGQPFSNGSSWLQVQFLQG